MGYRRVRGGLEASLKAAKQAGMIGAEQSALVAAARALADRMDEDIPGDNTSASYYLRYLQALGLTPKAKMEMKPEVAEVGTLQRLQNEVSARSPRNVA